VARHGTALVADPAARWRLDLAKGRWAGSGDPIAPDCPCPACRDHTRGYVHYLIRAGELTGKRLLTHHNLTFMAALMDGIRAAIHSGQLDQYSRAILDGGSPYGEGAKSPTAPS
jgi:queuine tRNA-ribosyltransferase